MYQQINNIFSKRVILEALKASEPKMSSYFPNEYCKSIKSEDWLTTYKFMYSFLKNNYRNEYYFKNTIFNKFVLGVHSLATAAAANELFVNDSICDFVLINDGATAFEIKTSFDNLERLEKQINDYYSVFNKVCVVIDERWRKNVLKIISEISLPLGLYVLNSNNTLTLLNEPKVYNKLQNKRSIINIFRKNEFEDVIIKNFGYLPDVPEYKYYDECDSLLMKLNCDVLYHNLCKALYKRRAITRKYIELFKDVPYELKYLIYFLDFNKKDYNNLYRFLSLEVN